MMGATCERRHPHRQRDRAPGPEERCGHRAGAWHLCDGHQQDPQRPYSSERSSDGPHQRVHRLAYQADQGGDCRGGSAMNRVFVDMDGVIVDFEAYKVAQGLTGDEVKRQPGAYLNMPAIPGAVEAVRSLIGMGFEVWIATKPPTGIPYAYSDKAAWVLRELPELKRRIIVTHDKGLLGDAGDFLCDDRPHKANCEQFAGTLLRFVDGYHWPQALDFFRSLVAHVHQITQPAAECQHLNKHVGWDYLSCKDCGQFLAAGHEWGIARGMWFEDRSHAEFYKKNGRLPEALGQKGGA
ncbi:hypothetical protein FEE59_13700 [Herbaspirillum sp. RU 5E]|nr:hypothetical protein [Herbaspirillum sp. RU 5E]